MSGDRSGHVSRARLLGPGSAIHSQICRAEQEAAAAAAAAAADDELEEVPQQAELTWSELWEARTTAGHVGTSMREEVHRHQQLQLWWPQQRDPGRRHQLFARQQNRTNLLKYNATMSRLLKRTAAKAAAHAGMGVLAGAASGAKASTTATGEVLDRGAAAGLSDVLGPLREASPAASVPMGPYAAGGDLKTSPAMEAAGTGVWTCYNLVRVEGVASSKAAAACEADADDYGSESAACGAANDAYEMHCLDCGAPRWDGPTGQLQQRLRAALCTADLDVTTGNQIVARMAAEAGRRSTSSLQLPPVMVHNELGVILADRRAAATAAETAGPMQLSSPPVVRDEAAITEAARDVAAGPHSAAAAAVDHDFSLQLLEQLACPDAAHGVFAQLLQWLTTQPQQQQQQRSASGQLVAAAAASLAAFAPGLMSAVFKQQNNLSDKQLAPEALQAWVGQLFDAAAAAAPPVVSKPAVPSSQQHQQPLHQPWQCGPQEKVAVVPLLRPLPGWTRYQLLDRPGAVLRQQLADVAAHFAESGRMPQVTRRFLLRLDEPEPQQHQQQNAMQALQPRGVEEGSGGEAGHNLLYEMLAEPVRVSEWLWWKQCSNRMRKRRLPGAEEAAVPGEAAGGGASGAPGGSGGRKRCRAEDVEDDVEMLESIECSDWSAVQAARRHVAAVLTAWHDLLAKQTLEQQQQQQQGDEHLPRNWRKKRRRQLLHMQQSLMQHHSTLQQAWCQATPFQLRTALVKPGLEAGLLAGSNVQQQEGRQQQQLAQSADDKNQEAAVHHGPAAAAGARRRAQIKQKQKQLAAAGPQAAALTGEEQDKEPVANNRLGSARRKNQQHAGQVTLTAKVASPTKSQSTTISSSGSDGGDASDDSSFNSSQLRSPSSSTRSDSDWTDSARTRKAEAGGTRKRGSSSMAGKASRASSSDMSYDGFNMAGTWEHDDEYRAHLQTLLSCVDDLAEHADGGSKTAAAIHPGTAWKLVPRSAAGPADANSILQIHDLAGLQQQLPAGVQSVLQQASSLGVSAQVIRRTMARLSRLFQQ